MSVTTSYLTFVLDQLSELGDVNAKRMFGGIGLYYDAAFFGLIDNDVVYFKVDDTSRADYEQRAMAPFRPVASKPHLISKHYYQVPGDVLEDPEQLAAWAKRAVQAARAKSAAHSKRTRGKRTAAAQPARAPTRARVQTKRVRTKASESMPKAAKKRS